MKPKSTLRSFLAIASTSLLAISYSHAATNVTWDKTPGTVGVGDSAITGGLGNWDVTNGNWTVDAGANNIAWDNLNDDTAIFGGTAGTVTLTTGITAGGLQFDIAGYTVTGNTLTFNTTGNIVTNADATVSSLLAGSAAITKTGAGVLTLNNAASTYAGQLTVADGKLAIAAINNVSANGNLGNSALPVILGSTGNTGTLRWTPASGGSSSKPFTIASGGAGAFEIVSSGQSLTFSGALNSAGNITSTASGTSVVNFSGGATLTASQTWTNNTPASTVTTELESLKVSAGGINYGANTLTFDGIGVTGFTGSAITGSGDFIKNGTGTVVFTAANTQNNTATFTGKIFLNAGVARFQDVNSIGSGNIEIKNTGILEGRFGGTLTRGQGTAANEIQITGGVSGLSGQGSTTIFNLGAITWGSATFNPTEFVLQSATTNTTGAGTLSSAINLNGATRTIRSDQTSGTTGSGTFSGQITNSGATAGLIKVGVGHHILSNTNNTYDGNTTINGGILSAAATGSLGSASNTLIFNGSGVTLRATGAITSPATRAVTMTSSAIIDTNNFAVSIAGNMTGASSSLTKNGLGTLTLSGTNNYSDTTVNAGTLAITKEASLNTGLAASWTAAKVNVKNAAGLTLSVDTTGAAGFTVANLNTLLGNISVANTAAQGLQAGATIGIDTGASPATFTPGNAITNSTGAFGGTIGLTKLGTGTLVLDQANTYTGITTISAGTIQLSGSGVILGPMINNGTLLVDKTATVGTDFLAYPMLVGSGSISANTGATVTISSATALQNTALSTTGAGSFILSGVTTPIFGGLSGATGDLATVISSGYAGVTNLTLNTPSGSTFTYGGVIANNAANLSLTKTGAGTQVLQGDNTYTGTTSINAGSLTVSGTAGSINDSSGVTVGFGATLNLDNGLGSFDRIKDAATLTLNGGTLVFTGNGATTSTTETIDTLAIGAGGTTITLTGAGAARLHTLAVTTGFSRTGNGTALIRGTSLQTAATNATRLSITGGTGLSLIGGGTENQGTLTTGTTTTLSIVPYLIGDTSNNGNGSSFLTYDDSGALRPLAATEYTTLTAGYTTPGTPENVNAFSGTITTASPTVNSLRFNGTQALNGSGTLTVNSGAIALTTNNAASIGAGFGSLLLGSGAWNEGVVTVTQNTLTINVPITINGNGVLTKAGGGIVAIANTIGAGTSTSLVVNSGTLRLSTAQSYTGGITLNGGSFGDSTVALPANTFNSNSITVNGTAAMAVANGVAIAGNVLINSTGTFRLGTPSGTAQIDGVLSGTGILDVYAPGGSGSNITLANTANTFTGGVYFSAAVNGGFTLAVNSLLDSASPGAGNIVMGNGGVASTQTLALHTGAVAPLSFTNRQIEIQGITAPGQTLKLANNNATQAFSINSNLLASGTGVRTLTLGGSGAGLGTFAGTITNGTLTTLNLTKADNNSTWELTNTSNSYNGTTTVSGGTLGFANGALGSVGTINASGGTLKWLSGNTQDISSRLAMTLATTSSFDTNGNDVTFATGIGGSTTGALTKKGAGTLTLGGTNTYTGTTTVSDGTLLVNGSLGAGAVAVNGGDLGGTGTIGGTVTVAAAGSVAPGASAGQLSIGGGLNISAPVNGGAGKLKFELGANTASSDRIAVTGALTIGTAKLGFADFTFSNSGWQDGTYKLINFGSISGTLDTLAANREGPIGAGTGTLQITGNDLELVVTGVGGGGNTAPTISDITNQSVPSGGNTGALAFTITDEDVNSVTLAGSSSNTTLVPNANIVFGGSGANRTVTVTPVSGLSGSATITVTLTDNGALTVQDTFTLTVTDNYLSWATLNGVTGGANGDHDNDGVKNLVEYALIGSGERGVFSGNTITYTKRGAPYGTDLTYIIETSETLVGAWTDAVTHGPGLLVSNPTISYTFTPGTPAKKFARLEVVTAP